MEHALDPNALDNDNQEEEPKKNTRKVGGLSPDDLMPEQISSGLRPGSMAFFIPGREEPLIQLHDRPIILGRDSGESDAEVCLDLSDDHALALGVSRRHARITAGTGGIFLEDLGSTNGTWLNDEQISANTRHHLRNGDQIKLSQLLIVVYFRLSLVPRTSNRTVLYLTEAIPEAHVTWNHGMPPGHLQDSLSDYLETAVTVQRLFNVGTTSASSEVSVKGMYINAEQRIFEVTFIGANDLLTLLNDVVRIWQTDYAEVVTEVRNTIKSAQNRGDNPILTVGEKLPVRAKKALRDAVITILKTKQPREPEDDLQSQMADKILVQILMMIGSPFEICRN